MTDPHRATPEPASSPGTEPDDRPWYAAAFGAHYPLLYRHRDETEAVRCLDLLPQLADVTGPVLDLGCGDGRHLARLAAGGVPAVGLDLSPHLLAVATARPELTGTPLVRGDMRRLPFGGSSFGTVLSLFTAFGYFGPPAANAEPVAAVARVLRPGGHWFLDYFDGDAVLAELGDGEPRTREREIGPLAVRETRRYDRVARQVVKEVHLAARVGQEAGARDHGVGPQGLRYAEQVAVFALGELDALADAQGLARVAAAGDYDGRPLGDGSRWLLVYCKRKRAIVDR